MNSTDTELDRQVDALLDAMLVGIKRKMETSTEVFGYHDVSPHAARAKAQIKQLIAKERLDEMKLATVGRVISKNKKSLTYMSGFGYAANNLQEHKNTRLAVLQAQADKGGEMSEQPHIHQYEEIEGKNVCSECGNVTGWLPE